LTYQQKRTSKSAQLTPSRSARKTGGAFSIQKGNKKAASPHKSRANSGDSNDSSFVSDETDESSERAVITPKGIAQIKDARSPSVQGLYSNYLKAISGDVKIYDINSVINTEVQYYQLHATFHTLFDQKHKFFIVEFNADLQQKFLTKSSFLNLMDFAENLGASQVVFSLSKENPDFENYQRSFNVIGFAKMTAEEKARYTLNDNFELFKYEDVLGFDDIWSMGEEEEEDA